MDGRKLITILAAALTTVADAERIPVVRVGLASLGSHTTAKLTSDQAFAAIDPATNQRIASWKGGEALTVQAEGNQIALGERRLPAIYFSAEAPTLKLTAGTTTRRYRGWIYAFANSGKLTLVNELPLESYLMGVVPCEMGAA